MSRYINLYFHGELNDFLPAHLRHLEYHHELKNDRSVKDLIESLGVPHTEVDLIIVNRTSVDFEYCVQGGDNIELYPPLNQAQLEQSPLAASSATTLKHCQPEPLAHPRFVADVHLGRLAAYLRLLGFDTLYRNDYEDALLADISADEQRILLSCDRRLLMRKQVVYGYFVRARQPQQQLLEIISRFELHNRLKPFTRCMHCNGELQSVDKHEIEAQLPPKTGKYYNEFYQCPQCKKNLLERQPLFEAAGHGQPNKNGYDSKHIRALPIKCWRLYKIKPRYSPLISAVPSSDQTRPDAAKL